NSGLPRRKSPRPRNAGGPVKRISRPSLTKYAAMRSVKSSGPRKKPKRSAPPRPIRRKRKQRSDQKRNACPDAPPISRSRSPPASIRWRIICPLRGGERHYLHQRPSVCQGGRGRPHQFHAAERKRAEEYHLLLR